MLRLRFWALFGWFAAVILDGTAPKPIYTPKLAMCSSYCRDVFVFGVIKDVKPLGFVAFKLFGVADDALCPSTLECWGTEPAGITILVLALPD